MNWLDEIDEREKKANPGPWEPDENAKVTPLFPAVVTENGKKAICLVGYSKDLQFIAQARTDIPRLSKRVRELEENLEITRLLLKSIKVNFEISDVFPLTQMAIEMALKSTE